MIKVRIQGQSYSIAQSIYEVDIHRLIKASSEREELAAISDIPLSLVARLDLDTFLPLIEFLNADYDYVSLDVKCKNVSQEPYEKLELAKKAMQDHEKLYMQVYHVAAVYHPERKKSIPIFQTGINLIHQIGLFLDEFAEMNQEEPDSFEKAAGIDKLTELGSFGTAYNLAGKDLTKMEAITEMPAVVVYTALLYNYRESKYMDELNRLKYPPK